MCRRIAVLALLLCLWNPGASDARAGSEPQPEQGRLRRHIETLASREFQGRRGAGGRRAAEYVADQLKTLELEPLFKGDYFQPIPSREGPDPMGWNVGAILRGSDPKLRDEWVIVSAHFDHLGQNGQDYYPGADDNASGVAMMLELARCFHEGQARPRRSVMFIGFDLEEIGLFGSRYFVEHAPIALNKIALFLTADMIGRSLGGVCDDYVFVMGSENAPAVRPWIREAAKDRPLTVGILGSDIMLLSRSDYGPFRSRQVPYLFFSTGENPRYHTLEDTAETIDYPKVEAISRVIQGIVARAVDSDEPPRWTNVPDHPLEEALTIRGVLKILLAHREDLKIGAGSLFLMNNGLRTLDGIADRGKITPQERAGLIQIVRIVMVSIF